MESSQCLSPNKLLGRGQSKGRRVTNRSNRRLGPCSAAVAAAAQSTNTHLVVPSDALHRLHDLDTAPQGASWGRKIATGLDALSQYGAAIESGFRGDFWQWCLRSGHPKAWPATSKKLAMRESETVMGNSRMRTSRILPIHRDVAPSGRALMQSHLKIAEGGGDLAPRIYFTLGPRTSTIHVGYIGPHKRMRNTRA